MCFPGLLGEPVAVPGPLLRGGEAGKKSTLHLPAGAVQWPVEGGTGGHLPRRAQLSSEGERDRQGLLVHAQSTQQRRGELPARLAANHLRRGTNPWGHWDTLAQAALAATCSALQQVLLVQLGRDRDGKRGNNFSPDLGTRSSTSTGHQPKISQVFTELLKRTHLPVISPVGKRASCSHRWVLGKPSLTLPWTGSGWSFSPTTDSQDTKHSGLWCRFIRG